MSKTLLKGLSILEGISTFPNRFFIYLDYAWILDAWFKQFTIFHNQLLGQFIYSLLIRMCVLVSGILISKWVVTATHQGVQL
jgi:hypothetical protein